MGIELPDERMIQLMAYAVSNGLARNESEYWASIKFSRTNISNIKKGTQSFTREHILNACLQTGASADWILGIDNNMFKPAQKSTIQTLKEIVAEMEGKLPKVHRWQDMVFEKNNIHA